MTREILDTIFSFLVPQYDVLTNTISQGKPHISSGDRATLLSAALTCRTISEAAQTALWNTMDSFAPLIPFLPLVKVDNSYKLSDALVHDGSRALRRLTQIRVFVFSKIEDLMSDFTVQMVFSSVSPVLFPNLSKLIIPNSMAGPLTPEQRMFLHLFLASPIRDIVIGDIHHSETFEAFASVLALRARDSLQSVSCSGSWNQFPRTITTLPSLHTIVLTGQLSDQNSVIADLSQCKSLRRLEICISKEIPRVPNPSYPATFFPSLENLTLSGHMTAVYILFFMKSPSLQTLRFRPRDWPQNFVSMLDCLISFLVDFHYKQRGWRSLAVLEITYKCAPPLAKGFTLDDKAYHNLFKRLSVLPLVSLELWLPVPFPSTVSLNFITSCFPGLHTLYLHQFQIAMAPTLDDLHALARTAPKLRHLGTHIRTEHINPSPRATNHLLDTLCVYDSSVEDPWYVAEQLDHSFPYLQKITTTSLSCKAGWKEVEKVLGVCHRSRRRF
ncbi:hypothetical protein BDN72DRAFT_254604 [Pluteus cervinus]|uniref:Uncharacterized protein n=1 Tax=Pluteus cervinus TaxID=181527 RepID=A0ACD3AG33_9AGAR|nr:hypothetical protein BDN72DRAFT_254604 [Pluteus cervinus]